MLLGSVRESPTGIRKQACKVAEEEPWVYEYGTGLDSVIMYLDHAWYRYRLNHHAWLSSLISMGTPVSGTSARLAALPILTAG